MNLFGRNFPDDSEKFGVALLQLPDVLERDEASGDDGVGVVAVDGHPEIVVDTDRHRPTSETGRLDLAEKNGHLVAEVAHLRIGQMLIFGSLLIDLCNAII